MIDAFGVSLQVYMLKYNLYYMSINTIHLLFDLVVPANAVKMVEFASFNPLFKDSAKLRSIEYKSQRKKMSFASFNQLLFFSVDKKILSDFRIYKRFNNSCSFFIILVFTFASNVIRKNKAVLSFALVNKSDLIIRESFFPSDIFQYKMPHILKMKHVLKEIILMVKLFSLSNYFIINYRYAKFN